MSSFSSFFGLFIDFSNGEESCVWENVRAYYDWTDSQASCDVLRSLRWIFSAATSWFPYFWEMIALDPEFPGL